jgi:hypothetical protein
MRVTHLFLAAFLSVPMHAPAQNTVVLNPNDVQLGPYRHKELPPALLARIRATTNVFEKVDGTSYERAVDLYKRDLNPEENLVLWEEMAKAYTTFCKSRCTTDAERMDVYRALLLRSMFEEPEAIRRTDPKVLNPAEVRSVVKLYKLPAKPIDVIKGK